VNEKNLNSTYDFIPFGIRHDNPLYSTSNAAGKEEAINLFKNFSLKDDMQKIATEKGFNANNDFKSEVSVSGTEVSQALQLYNKIKIVEKILLQSLLLIAAVLWLEMQ
jgi:Ca-activated chloride channel family protein